MNGMVAGIAGLLFGVGLLVSGMTNPANIVAFLDVAGAWQPALMFTMAAAVVVALPAFTIVRRRGKSLRGQPVSPINRRSITTRLILGSTLFGVGWGLSGICPGPGLILLTTAGAQALVFVTGLIAGTLAARWLTR